jgi:hypothetical protein
MNPHCVPKVIEYFSILFKGMSCIMCRYSKEPLKIAHSRRLLLKLWLSLKSMKRILTNYGTVYLSNG